MIINLIIESDNCGMLPIKVTWTDLKYRILRISRHPRDANFNS